MADVYSVSQTYSNAGGSIAGGVLGANALKSNIESGLAGRTVVLKLAKTDMTNAEVNTVIQAITRGRTSTATNDDAGTIVGFGTANGSAFVSGTTDVVFLHVQTTGTLTAQGSNAYDVTGAVTTVEHILVPKL
jgi:hypothetical protein